jgi:hypothetical protein
MKDKTVIIVGVGAVAAVGLLLYMRSRAQAQVMMPTVPGTGPTVAGVATDVFTNIFGQLINKATTPTPTTVSMPAGSAFDQLVTKIRARGDAHYLAWSAAFRKELKYYVFGGKCFETATGNQAAASFCPVLQLEGY